MAGEDGMFREHPSGQCKRQQVSRRRMRAYARESSHPCQHVDDTPRYTRLNDRAESDLVIVDLEPTLAFTPSPTPPLQLDAECIRNIAQCHPATDGAAKKECNKFLR